MPKDLEDKAGELYTLALSFEELGKPEILHDRGGAGCADGRRFLNAWQ